ncbi:RNA polymerase sigma factor [Pseudoalteromonas sp. McH1-7]|uniref:RNA polymerase sigma-70 factor, ECF subfamily n=1 Tax=Pseudoalteromonas peptidolytica F12-50-A1 TaxID=1315280 RepID=A0A8I0T3G8_9GAMM|nr:MULTISPECIES: RNA polymerase sigma factor [Pseudoalteromonas]NUZ10775.1 RNA polymerase sigma factor [Pseudoalteromonas sp. McH1-7]MBE0345093.1 RNA polymerase sigma-70 factor, ECF subfamily [Pseudoalteromonas peptidolytica F12-50-A1]MDW7550319.1 RNA polymerase sigma factor [Pseudoalteromonas peptidolytica]NLR14909.1 RNA polymerase sigma factor [Pseudoalteromonas peptidolytica]RRS08921.1 RNA polymerase sigma factor [Pseudoalteromonas sp. J010]
MFFNSEKQLIKRALQGNQGAWASLCKQHHSRVYNQCLRLVGEPQDALDIAQDVFISMHRNLHTFNGNSQFSTWVFKITHARIVDHMRKRKFESIEGKEPEVLQAGPDAGVAQQQSNQEIYDALKQLPFEQRIVVELKFFQHYTFEEIAMQLELSTNTVKARLYNALSKMKGQLEVRDHG